MVDTAIIPVAGLATRFLPVSKQVPKALLPILNKPMIEFAIEEAYLSGIRRIMIIMGPDQFSIKDYFENDYLDVVKQRVSFKEQQLEKFIEIINSIEVSYIVQEQPLGLGHAILQAEPYIGNDSFCVFLPDDVIFSGSPCMSDMIGIYNEFSLPVLAIKEVSEEKIPLLGIVDVNNYKKDIYEIVEMVEKPALEKAPSNLAIIGRYVLPASVFGELKNVKPGANGEIQITDALIGIMKNSGFNGYIFPGIHFDVGNPIGLLQASVYAITDDSKYGAGFIDWLKSQVI